MRELSLMGISAIQLMPSVEAVCKKALEDLIGLHPVEIPNFPAAPYWRKWFSRIVPLLS